MLAFGYCDIVVVGRQTEEDVEFGCILDFMKVALFLLPDFLMLATQLCDM